jgi:hypothetical protein
MQTANIREHMKVVGSDRQPVGTVDKVEGDKIKLSRSDPQAQGRHHYIPSDWVDSIQGDQVCLRQNAQEACQNWLNA